MPSLKNTPLFFAATLVSMLVFGMPALAGHDGPVPESLKITEIEVGTGDEAKVDDKVKVHYTGWLTDGTQFDSSRGHDRPFSFRLGAGRVIRGWEFGVRGMRVGGKRELVIPPELGYGPKGYPGSIPPNATLKFEIELLEIAGSGFINIDNAKLKDLIAQGVTVVDVRRVEEWKQTGVVEGSELITAFDGEGRLVRSFFGDFTDVANKDQEVILICRTGSRTLSLSKALADQAGYTKVYNVEKGIEDWIKQGNPVVKN
ncbi:MAG: FKBP-type peptidyl-prolyl cis-trans isomerase [Rhodospirillaceae bacterium]|nr:FKBP-type peptidyl-prolyl cis-trans isomerase [Rhodospirillaceae bacterium]